ncbi:MAG: alpha/beta hydrolase [Chloroflexi bacterium HGW-Chloroflexi-4]|jgi:dienelactone hydrolase|nr:MAG: alpha/beta hydrolase [Chloroflexi bacterium HGW-Chloroflexi-4]
MTQILITIEDSLEIIVLFAVLFFEVVFALFIGIKKKRNSKLISVIKIALFITFIALLATSVITWNFRWYGFGILLGMLAFHNVILLFRKQHTTSNDKSWRLVMNTLGMLALWVFALLPVLIFPQYSPIEPGGEYKVETKKITYSDPSRIETYTDNNENRKLTVQYWYPADANGKYPLVIFSHGSFGTVTSNVSLFSELASHGYVVASIGHTYQSLYTTDADGKTILLDNSFMREVSIENAKTNKQQSFEFYKKWMSIRMGDIDFVINTILNQENIVNHDPLFDLVDQTKIGVMGHSLGGSAALGLGEVRKDIGAVVALESPFMYDIIGVENEAFVWNEQPYPLPLINIYSDSSWNHLNDWPQYALNARLLSEPTPDTFNFYLQGAVHLSLTDLGLTSPTLTNILSGEKYSLNPRDGLAKINQIVLNFFDSYLKGQGEFSLN